MPSPGSVVLSADRYDFVDNGCNWSPVFNPRSGGYYDPNTPRAKYANKNIYLNLDGNDYQLLKVKFTVLSGNLKNFGVSFFSTNDEVVSVSTSIAPGAIFSPSTIAFANTRPVLILINNYVQTVPDNTCYVVCNAFWETPEINFKMCFTTDEANYDNVSILVEWECGQRLYETGVGVHCYSPYDAANPRLSTDLYSLENLSNWGVGTRVYADKLLRYPAYPWYYARFDEDSGTLIGVYKVGENFRRPYGTKLRYRRYKAKWSFKVNTWKEIQGPQDWTSFNNDGQETSPSCVVPSMSKVGEITKVFEPNNLRVLEKPVKYRYYMGLSPDTGNQENDCFAANNDVFNVWSWNTRQRYPVVGTKHALMKLSQSVLEGFRFSGGYIDSAQGQNFWDVIGEVPLALIAAAAGTTLAGLLSNDCPDPTETEFIPPCPRNTHADPNHVHNWFNNISEAYYSFAANCSSYFNQTNPGDWLNDIWANLCNFINKYWPYIAAILFIVALIIIIVEYIERIDYYIEEDCLIYKHVFTDTPYIDLSSESLNLSKTVENYYDGWFCDGMYNYRSNFIGVTNKRINNIPYGYGYFYNGIVSMQRPQNAIKADDPVHITDISKLLVLCYTSGEPLPECGGEEIYFSDEIVYTIPLCPQSCSEPNPDPKICDYCLDCCDMEDCEGKKVTVPYAYAWSCQSLEAANQEAQDHLDYLIRYYLLHHFPEPLPEIYIGRFPVYFTHQIAIENKPTLLGLTFDLRLGEVPVIGQKLYYDNPGCTLAMDGYYALSASTYTPAYRTFLHTTNGVIDSVEYMERESSKETDLGTPIIFYKDDLSSNWFLRGDTMQYLNDSVNYITGVKKFDLNDLYNNYTVNGNEFYLIKGRSTTPYYPQTVTNFIHYPNFNSNDSEIAPNGYYQAIMEWPFEYPFVWQSDAIINIDTEELCTYLENTAVTPERYFNFIARRLNGYEFALTTPLTIQWKAFDGEELVTSGTSTFLQNYTQTTIPMGTFNNPLTSIIITSISPAFYNGITYNIGSSVCCHAKICNQYWLTYDYYTKNFANGDTIPFVYNANEWFSAARNGQPVAAPKSYDGFDNILYYNWYVINDSRGIKLPNGYRLPTISDYNELQNCPVITQSGALKLKSLITWNTDNGFDSFGFNGQAWSYLKTTGNFAESDFGKNSWWWLKSTNVVAFAIEDSDINLRNPLQSGNFGLEAGHGLRIRLVKI